MGRRKRTVASGRRRGLALCLWETAFSQTFVSLTGGAFLVGYALALGAGPLYVGWLAALPFLCQVAQLGGAWLTEKVGGRKPVTLIFIGSGRAAFLLLVPIAFLGPSAGARASLLAVVTVSSALSLAGAVAWLSWLADLVPASLRGRWVARRQQIIGVMTIVAPLAGGWLVDRFTRSHGAGVAFSVLFGLAGLAALVSQGALAAQHAPVHAAFSRIGLRMGIREPLAHRGFRKVLISFLVWNVGIGVSAPFFAVYMFRNLEMSYTLVALHGAIVALTSLVTNPAWGRLVDRFGVRPVLLLNSFLIVLVPLFWFFPTSGRLFPVWIEAVYSGFVWTGFNLASFSLPFSATPARGRSYYLAFLSIATGLGYGLASVAGGVLGKALAGLRIATPWGTPLLSFHAVFFLSSLLRLAAALRMRGFEEPGSRATGTMIQVVGYGVLKRLSLGRQWFLAPTDSSSRSSTGGGATS